MYGEHERPESRLNEPEAEQEIISLFNRQIRYDIKNLRDGVLEITNMPNREELLRAFDDILRLAPPKSEHDEAVSEYVRRTERGEVLPELEDPGEPTDEELARFLRKKNP